MRRRITRREGREGQPQVHRWRPETAPALTALSLPVRLEAAWVPQPTLSPFPTFSVLHSHNSKMEGSA